MTDITWIDHVPHCANYLTPSGLTYHGKAVPLTEYETDALIAERLLGRDPKTVRFRCAINEVDVFVAINSATALPGFFVELNESCVGLEHLRGRTPFPHDNTRESIAAAMKLAALRVIEEMQT